MELALSLLIIALTISLLFSLSKLISWPYRAPLALPPGPAPLPLIGNLLDLDRQPHCSLARLAKVYGPVISLKLGLTTAIVISSPEAAREVLQKKDAFFSARSVPDSSRAYNYHDASMFFLPSTSPLWRRNRAICAVNLFSTRCLETSRDMRAQKARDIIDCFRKKAGHPVDIGHIFFSGMLNMISNVLFSQDIVDINSESPQEFEELIKESINENLKPNASDFFPFLRLFDLQGRRRTSARYHRQYHKTFNVIVDARLQHRRNGGKNYGDFLDSLLDLLAQSKISRKEIQILFTELFGAGSHTTSITVEWAMGELLHDPIAMAKAQAEVREVFAIQNLEESDALDLPYLQAVIKEAMRLHPPGPLLLHKAIEDGVTLCGYRVPREAQVLVNAWAIGRDPKVWTEPDVFRPERFLEKHISFHGRDFEFIPFGSGKKICPGLPFAVKIVPFLLALILAEFDWKLPDGMEPKDVDLTEKFAAVLELAVPLHAIPVPVNN
ncbi:Cytochrome P450 76C4 [Rhynchospora pubera]|uniref:Cytochrome P450 76C4 n=1 Tax=Rhynchospora pubera TaxID=906938 RepID=A0AAV8DXS3_9POAL|nr:Cytochrome P450 76C4 [Rhynchospora pubera]